MTIATTVEKYLKDADIKYDLLKHDRRVTAHEIAASAHIPGKAFAKGVLLTADGGYVMAVIPASARLDLMNLSHQLNERLGLASDMEVEEIFADCDRGAVPAFGAAYGMRTIVDESLDQQDEIFMEAGDHINLVHLDHDSFEQAMTDAEHFSIARTE